MTVLRRLAVALVLLATLAACSSSSKTPDSGLSATKIDLTKLSSSVDGLSAYEVVQRYKSHWLRKRGPTSVNNPVSIKVYLDGNSSAYGSVESLRNIRAENVATITRLNAQEAHFRYGLGNVAGALVVDTKPAD